MQSKVEAEPGLYDVVQPLTSRWKLILGGILLAVGIAAVATSFLPRQYQTSFVLVLGFTGEIALEDPATVTTIINSDSFQQASAQAIGLKIPTNSLKKMVHAETDANRWNTNWVTVQITAQEPDTAVRLANAIADGIVRRHTAYYEQNMKPLKEHHSELLGSIQRLTSQIDVLKQQSRGNGSVSTGNLSTDFLLQTRITDGEHQLIELRKSLRDAEVQMSASKIRNSAVVAPPLRPQRPSKPNLKLNLIAAAMGSAFLMITLILLYEQYRKSSLRF